VIVYFSLMIEQSESWSKPLVPQVARHQHFPTGAPLKAKGIAL
jgi:hypothetical protein